MDTALIDLATEFVASSEDPDPGRLSKYLTARSGRRVTRPAAVEVLDELAVAGVVTRTGTRFAMPDRNTRSNTMPTATKAPAKRSAGVAGTSKAPAAKRPARASAAKKSPARPSPPPARADDSLAGQLAVRAVVPVKLIAPHPDNPRRDLGDIDGLAQSIREQGLVQALVVFRPIDTSQLPAGAEFFVIAGHRRLAAATLAGVDVPIDIRDEPSRMELLELFLTENGQREALDPIAEANVILTLVTEGRMSQKACARKLGRSEAFVSERLALVKRLPAKVQERVTAGDLAISDALAIATAKDLTDKDRDKLSDSEGDALRSELDKLISKNRRRAALDATKAKWPDRLVVTDDPAYSKPRGIDAPFGLVKYGTGPGQVNRMPEMDPAEHQVIYHDHPTWGTAPKVTVTVWHTAPHLLAPGDFKDRNHYGVTDDGVPFFALTDDQRAAATLVDRLDGVEHFFTARDGATVRSWQAHEICPGHRLVVAPWAEPMLRVCVQPHLHQPGGGPSWLDLAEAWAQKDRERRAASPTPERRTSTQIGWRERLGDELATKVEEKITAVLDDLGPGLALIMTGDYALANPTGDNTTVDLEATAADILGTLGRSVSYVTAAVERGAVPDWDDVIAGRWLLEFARANDLEPPAALVTAFEPADVDEDQADESGSDDPLTRLAAEAELVDAAAAGAPA